MKHINWFIDLLVVYWQNIKAGKSHKGSCCPGHDVSVRKVTAKTWRLVEIKSGLSSQNVAPFLPVFVGCRFTGTRLTPHFSAMSLVANTSWKALSQSVTIVFRFCRELRCTKALNTGPR